MNIVCFKLGNPFVTIQYLDIESGATILFNDILNPRNIVYEISLLPVLLIKAVIVCFWRENIEHKSQIAKQLDSYYSALQIPLFCFSWNSIFISSTFLACAKKHGDKIFDDKMDLLFCEENSVTSFHVIKHKNGYQISSIISDKANRICITDNDKIFITCSHRNAPVSNGQKKTKNQVLNHLKPKTTIEINNNIYSFFDQAIINRVLNAMGEKSFKYNICTTGFYDYGIRQSHFSKAAETKWPIQRHLISCLIYAKMNEIIPFKKTIAYYKDFKNIALFQFGSEGPIKLSQDYVIKSGTALTLSINKFFQPQFELQSCEKRIKNGAIICFWNQTFSVEIIKDGNLHQIGLDNIPLMISFVKGQCQIGEEAKQILTEHNSYVIIDLLEIIKNNKIEYRSKWGFKVMKESGETLIEFDTFRGRRKASPLFLLTFFVKWSVLKAAENLGTMPEVVSIVTNCLDENMEAQFKALCSKFGVENFQIQTRKIIEIDN